MDISIDRLFTRKKSADIYDQMTESVTDFKLLIID